jgi:ABC-2 type transport system permease protein
MSASPIVNWDQLRTVLWLRWRLTRNQWAKSGGIGAAIAAIVAAGVLVLAVLSLGGGLTAGLLALGRAKPLVVMAVWLTLTGAFLFMWLIGLITELQRSETIDLQRLMHLPVLLGQIFVVNYAASHLSVSVTLFVPAALGLAIGLAISRGPSWLLMIPLALGMVFMVTAWTYLLRGWLATLMSNPRRRRAIVMAITGGFILIAQAPNIYFNVIRRVDRPAARRAGESAEARAARDAREAEDMAALLRWQVVVPPLWVPVGAQALAEGRMLPAILGLLGVTGLGALGLRRAYTSTLRFYHGETGGKAAAGHRATARVAGPPAAGVNGATTARQARARGGTATRDRTAFLERRFPRVPEAAAAVGLATFQSMLRAPEIKMQWGSSFLVTLLVGAPLLFRASGDLPAAAGPFITSGVVVFSMFLMIGVVGNQFGFDRDGFRALVLSPAERWQILLGKNLAAFPAAAASAMILVLVITIWLRLSPLVLLASLLQLVVGVLGACVAGNLMSILVPYRIQPGSMKPTKMPGLAMLLLVVSQMSLPLALTPVFVPPLAGFVLERYGIARADVINLLLSLVLAAATVLLYWWSLFPTGRLLQRRETRILQTVSASVE